MAFYLLNMCKKYSARGREGRSGGRCRRSPLGICETTPQTCSSEREAPRGFHGWRHNLIPIGTCWITRRPRAPFSSSYHCRGKRDWRILGVLDQPARCPSWAMAYKTALRPPDRVLDRKSSGPTGVRPEFHRSGKEGCPGCRTRSHWQT